MPAASDGVSIAGESPERPDVLALLQAADRYFAALYAVDSNHLLAVERLLAPDVTFLAARRNGVAVATGALVDCGGWGEIKRMYVDPPARGLDPLRLETGVRQHGAPALYRGAGYVERGPFGAYRADRESVFMERSPGAG